MNQNELEAKIKAAQMAYYAGTPEMSDADFDNLWDLLKSEYPDSKVLTQVGSDLGESNGFKKVRHNIVMGSQDKANTAEEMDKFFKRNESRMLYQYKMDGSSVVLEYVNGKLVRGASRGNGEIGIDYTDNIRKMNGVLAELKDKSFTGSIRGEVLLSKSNKDKYFPDAPNCRNMATGIFHRLDNLDCDKLDVVVYDAQYLDKSKSFEYQSDVMSWLENQGFKVANWEIIDNCTGKKAIEIINNIWKTLSSYDYDIDGIVWKQNSIDMTDIMNNYRPRTQVALKREQDIVLVKSIEIEWSMTNGTFTPVIIFEPVEILGATVSRASASNVAMLELLDFEVGDTIGVIRAGMIVPKVVANFSKDKKLNKYIPRDLEQSV